MGECFVFLYVGIHVVPSASAVRCRSQTLAQEYLANPLLIRGFKYGDN
jgi:hypothetical protein